MTKCLSLDSNKSSVIPPLKHCLVTTVPSCSSGRPLKGVRANKCCIYTHVPWRISQLWEWRRGHTWADDWEASSSGCHLSELQKFAEMYLMTCQCSGLTKSRISYVFWLCGIFPQVIMQSESKMKGWENRQTLEENTHLLLSFLHFLGAASIQQQQQAPNTQSILNASGWVWLAWSWSDQADYGFSVAKPL